MARATMRGLGEFGFIRQIARRTRSAKSKSVVVGIGDDAAVLRLPKALAILTTDMLVENVHFRRKEATPYEIGWKAMAVNVSDAAAMGAVPTHAVIAAGLPPNLPVSYADGIYRGLRAMGSRFGLQIVGGDTNRSDKIVLAVTVLGHLAGPRPILRSGAKPGDILFVTGALGGSYSTRRHLRFTPRVKEALHLVKKFNVHAMMDLSDGLASDLRRISEESRVGASVFEAALPLARGAKNAAAALFDGEDFELLFALSQKDASRLVSAPRVQGLAPFTAIGRVTPASWGLELVRQNGSTVPLPAPRFRHFR